MKTKMQKYEWRATAPNIQTFKVLKTLKVYNSPVRLFVIRLFCISLISLYLIPYSSHAQNARIDSLLSLLKKDKEDTNKVNHLNALSEQLWRQGDYQPALQYANEAITLNEKVRKRESGKVRQGESGRLTLSLSRSLAATHSNIGIIYTQQGNYPDALKEYFAALKIREEILERSGNPDSKAYREAQKGIATSHNNIGIIYRNQGNYPDALKEHFAALKTFEEIGNKNAIATSHNNIGEIYMEQATSPLTPLQKRGELFTDALKEHFASLKIREEIGDKDGIATSHINIGETYLKQGRAKEGKEELQKGLELSKAIGSKERIKESYAGLAEADSAIASRQSAIGNWQGASEHFSSAYNNYKLYIIYKDSILNEENTKKTVRAQMKFEFDKKDAASKAEQEKKDAIAAEEKRKQKIITYSISGGLLLVLLLAFFIFRGYRQKQKANKELADKNTVIEEQKKIVEEKNKDITDSINYASRIQGALLTSDNFIGKHLKEYFILFKPKDVVSGDFYWANYTAGSFLLCCGDCTGHGVPGAFMSLLNISILNEVTVERKITEPHLILNEAREEIIRALNLEGSAVTQQDGMDCILMSFRFEVSGLKLEYSAANNAPVLIHDGKIIQLEADNMPVGLSERKHPFTHRAIEPSTINHLALNPDFIGKPSTIYLYTDGYADQFGGPKGKKFKYKQLNELLLAISDKGFTEQKEILNKTFDEWKGGMEQVDDVLLIGIRV
ncbi:MAG: tetratricopeptide repeat protein [Bacteroidetes bacterium]|nr:tetratricopeptide repeat protein [Bacteroidota bacterium]